MNLADSYPQAPISGGTPKMRKVIVEVNRVDDPENDFIYKNIIPIESQPLFENFLETSGGNQDKDYTRFIMKVINKVIETPQYTTQDNDRTIFETFRTFNEYLFAISESKEIQSMRS